MKRVRKGFFYLLLGVRKENKMVSGTPLGQMYIELGLDVSKFNPTLNGAKNAVKCFRTIRNNTALKPRA